MTYDASNKRASDLTPADISAILATAGPAVGAMMLATERGHITGVYPSDVISPQGAAGVLALGSVAWLRVANTQPGAAWCALQAWAAGLDAAPESIRAIVAAARALPIAGKHVSQLTAADISLAQEYALAKNHDAVEIDINAKGFCTGAYVVDARGGSAGEVEGTQFGATVGAAANADEALCVLLFQNYAGAQK